MTINVYTLGDVSKHKSKNDLWVVVHNKVYDISSFIMQHPGGEEVLIDEAGKDATEAFEDIGHSDEARQILEKHLIGILDDAKSQKRYDANLIRADDLSKEQKSGLVSLRIILPVLAIIGTLVYKYAFVSKAQ